MLQKRSDKIVRICEKRGRNALFEKYLEQAMLQAAGPRTLLIMHSKTSWLGGMRERESRVGEERMRLAMKILSRKPFFFRYFDKASKFGLLWTYCIDQFALEEVFVRV